MKIRTRLTIWYATILIISLTVIGIGTYQEISEQLTDDHRQHIWEHALDETSEMLLWVGLPAVLFGLLGGWWITRKALAPVTALTNAVEKIHDSNLNEQLKRTGNGDELDRLTEVFNAMTMRLDGSFQRIREFTLHASHELKTPLTVIRGELETALDDNVQTPVSKEKLASMIDEIERLAKIVDGLTLLTKADAGQVKLNLEPVQLDDLARESFADTKILAQSRNIEVNLSVQEQITICGDRHRLRQLLLNLTDNAVKYNRPSGRVNISLQRLNGFAELKIENTGAGIAPELQPRVFERFFRGNSSHSNQEDGCGLGLSIVQWIVFAHGGKIQIKSTLSELTTVTVQLPVEKST